MPKKTPENKEIKSSKKSTSIKASKETLKTTVSDKASTKKVKTEKILSTSKKSSEKSETSSTKAKATKSKSTKPKKQTTKSQSSKAKTSTPKRKSTTKKESKVNIVEYYDLPYRYNQTIVKVLAQTPKTLFVYWDISDEDRENYKLQFGKNFFETTKPVLIIYNDTLHYSFEVDINDFANSWYLHVNDSNSDYRVELGRRPISYNKKIQNNYIYITSSNKIESPNDHILFDKSQKMLYFRNVKTNKETAKPISTLSFIRNMGKIYNLYDLYKEIYKNENIEEIYDLSNPSSNSSSQFK
jgi:hypothetical protein